MKDNNLKQFLNICKMPQMLLKSYLKEKMKKYYDTVIDEDGFLYCKGNYPILLTAHMDTVHKEIVSEVVMETQCIKGKKQHIVFSPQGIGGDDRCGIYMILYILQNGNKNMRPSVLFCEEEEVGGVGSYKFTTTEYVSDLDKMKFLIELDRANADDAVFYEDINYDFHRFVEKATGFRENYGTFSDICNLSPVCKVSSVNLSCGYYKQHTTQEYVVLEEMESAIKATEKLIKAAETVEQFEYIEDKASKYDYSYYGYNYNYAYNGGKYYKYGDSNYELYVCFMLEGKEEEVYVQGKTEAECWMNFFMTYSEVRFNDVLDFDVY